MKYALIAKGAVQRYPYSFDQLQQDNPQVSFPAEPSDELFARYGVLPVASVTKPSPSNAVTKDVVQATPVLIDGVWTQVWVEADASALEILQRQRATADATDKAAITGDSFVSQFIAMTPAQVAAYVETNVTSLATAKTVIAKLGQMLLLLARREFR